MSTYICLGQWTQKGIENIRESPARLDAAREDWKKDGATIRDFFYDDQAIRSCICGGSAGRCDAR